MASVLAIVSKAVFEQLAKANGGAELGTVLPLDRYASTHKSLSPLAAGGSLFLVTVRPPDEQLWLVAILDAPVLDDEGWSAAANTTPITDISSHRKLIEFASGTGIHAKAGALGMSLQTPRALTEAGAARLRTATGANAKPTARKSAPPAKAARTPKAAKPAKLAKPAKPVKAAKSASSDARLDALEAAIADDDAVAALEAALVAWRSSFDDALADLIDAIAGKLEGDDIPDEAAWSVVAASQRAADVGRLLAAIPDMPVSFLPQAGARLAERPADPRIAMAIATWTLEPPTTSSSTYPFWTKTLDYAGKSGDRRIVPVLQKRLRMKQGDSDFWPKFYKALTKVKDAVATVEQTPVDGKQLAKAAKAAKQLSAVTTSVAVKAKPQHDLRAHAKATGNLEGAPLVNAATQLGKGRLDAAIEQLLVAWRAQRVPEIADAIDRASRLSPWYRAPLGDTPKAIDEGWRAAWATDAVGRLPQLLPAINFGGPKFAEARLSLLATLPEDDPRISIALAETCSFFAERISPERTQYWKALFELVARMRDVRVCEPMRLEFRDFEGKYYNHHRQGRRIVGDFVLDPAKAFGGSVPTLDAAGRKQLAAVDKLLAGLEAKRDTQERALLQAIADEWESDAPRLVYADWLSERAHPRGELIVLACKPSRTAAEDKRYQQLVRDVPYAIGPAREFAYPPTLDRGIISALETNWGTSTLTWRTLAGDPSVALVETIAFHETVHAVPRAADVAYLVDHPSNLRLQTVTNFPNGLLDEVAPLVKKFVSKGGKLVRR